jgi:hypothetical protein
MQVERRVTDLSPEDRRVMERLLGRPLQESEVVQVSAEDAEVARKIAAHRALLESMREMQASFAHIPEDELDALIDEACDYVRHNPK